MTRIGWFIIAVLLAVPAHAAHRRHTARPGETATGLARHYYGAIWKAVYLRAHNKLTDDVLTPGKVLELPKSYLYKARAGDSYASIAKRRLFSVKRYPALLQFNGLRENSPLSVGKELLMPFHLFHFAEDGDSLSKIAQQYYRTRKLARMLREYNDLESNALEVGQKVVVPIFDKNSVDLDEKPAPEPPTEPASGTATAAPDSAEAPSSPTPVGETASGKSAPDALAGPPREPADPAPGAEPALELPTVAATIRAYRNGYFKGACRRFESFLERGTGQRDDEALTSDDRNRVIQYLGFCAVAEGDARAASDYFRSWLLTNPEATLDRRLTSPKILTIFDSVAQEVRRTD